MKSCFGCPLFLVVLLVEQENLSIDVYVFLFPSPSLSLSLSLSLCGLLRSFHPPTGTSSEALVSSSFLLLLVRHLLLLAWHLFLVASCYYSRECYACFGCQFFHMLYMLKHAHPVLPPTRASARRSRSTPGGARGKDLRPTWSEEAMHQ